MIPKFVKSTCLWTAVLAVVACPYLLRFGHGASMAFALSTAWMIANLLVWTAVIVNSIRPGDRNPLFLLAALFAKLALLIGGVIAMRVFAPHTRAELMAIVAGISSILVVAVLKAIGARLTRRRVPAVANHVEVKA